MPGDYIPGGDRTDVGWQKCDVGCGSDSAFLRSANRGDDDRRNLVAFAHPVGELGVRDDPRFDEEVEPIRGFVGFGLPPWSPSVFDDAKFVNEVRTRSRSAQGPIVGSDGRGRAKQLLADHVRRARGWRRFGQLDDPQGERLGPVPQVGRFQAARCYADGGTANNFRLPTSEFPLRVGPWSETATIGA